MDTRHIYLHSFNTSVHFKTMRRIQWTCTNGSNLKLPHIMQQGKNVFVGSIVFLVEFHSSIHIKALWTTLHHYQPALCCPSLVKLIVCPFSCSVLCVCVCEQFISPCEFDSSCRHSPTDSWTHSSWESDESSQDVQGSHSGCLLIMFITLYVWGGFLVVVVSSSYVIQNEEHSRASVEQVWGKEMCWSFKKCSRACKHALETELYCTFCTQDERWTEGGCCTLTPKQCVNKEPATWLWVRVQMQKPDVFFRCRCWSHQTSDIFALSKLEVETSHTVHVLNQNLVVVFSCFINQTKQNSPQQQQQQQLTCPDRLD